MSDSLGLSIGSTNLVTARIGRPPVMRRSILTVFDDRAPEVGVPGENPNLNQPGMVLSGFVERVGDPVPLVAADGSPHRGERVLVEALDAMARTVGGGAPVVIAVPAHWGPATVDALRGALRAAPTLTPDGAPPALVADSAAALAALQAAPGLPSDGVVVLCDFGGSGTSISLADAGADLASIGETVRYPDFSGDQVDQVLLNHVVAGIAAAGNADPAGTAAVSSLARLRNESRLAKERLSAETAAVVHAQLPGFDSDVRVTRTELERLIEEPLAGVLNAVEEALQRNNIPLDNVSAVATVGGGANIPLVTQQLSTRLRAPVITTPQSQLNVAAGAALVADAADAATGMAAVADAPTGMAPTSMSAAAWAAGAAGVAAAESAADGAGSATFRALAWSQDDSPAGEPVPYAGEDYTFGPGVTGARPAMEFAHEEEGYEPEPPPLPWYRRPVVLFGAAAAAALLAVGGLAVTLTGTSGESGPVTETATTVETGPSPEGTSPPPPQTITVTGEDGLPTTTVVPPPPPPPTTSSAETATTTTTTAATTTTTTTTAPTTTTTTRVTTTQPTTTQPPPTTTEAPPTTTVEPIPDEPIPAEP